MHLSQREIDEEITQAEKVKKHLIKRKRVLEIQEAQQGNNALAHIVTEIQELTEKISAYESKIARLKALVTTGSATSSIRILYVEDVHEYAKRYRELLHAHFGADNVKWVETARAALYELNSHPPDVMVADLFIPRGPDYTIPIEAEGLPRSDPDENISYDYGADICAVALQKGIPIVALSTAPIRHPVREPIE